MTLRLFLLLVVMLVVFVYAYLVYGRRVALLCVMALLMVTWSMAMTAAVVLLLARMS